MFCASRCARVSSSPSASWLRREAYLAWNYQDPETAVMGTALHALEWLFVRLAPIVFVGAVAGICLTRK